jgi:tight adherence protein C
MLNTFNQMAVTVFGPMGPTMMLGGVGLIVALLAYAFFAGQKDEPFAKLKSQSDAAKSADSASKSRGSKAELRRSETGDKMEKLDRYAHFLEPQSAEQMTASRQKMLRAGYRAKNSVRIFHFAQMVLGVGFLILGAVYTIIVSNQQEMSTQALIMYTLIPGGFGYYLPIYWITRRIETRKQQIVDGFPDALDMMVVCVEAGQSLDQSILRVAREGKASYPALAEEFDIVANEVKAGKERVTVLKDMAERVGVADVQSFVTTLVQSASFGTSISEALRVYSGEMRDKRVLRAEEKANTLPTKLTLGTMMFTVPPLMIILIGPSVHGIGAMLNPGG